MKRGIDISRHQGNLDFDYIKENFDFVIIRCAYGSDLSEDDSECRQCDSMAQTYIDECKKRGIPYGLYLYQYAGNNDESLSEAAHIREWYNKCNPTMGLYLDIEDADRYKAENGIDYHYTQELALVWLDALSDITAKGIYASHSWLNDYMNVDELIEHGALIWEAHWDDNGEICEDKFAMSQETSDYYLNDGTRVDYDIMRDELFDRLIQANEYDHRNDNISADETDTEHLQYQIGDYVEYNAIYASSTSESGLTPSQGFNSGTITRVIPWAANPYLINDGTGWINDGCITSEDNSNTESSDNDINVGDKVRVLVNATYDGGSFAMYYDEYDVLEVKGDRVVIGIGDVVTCAINICNIERI
uniref:GH25 family lysozyme n=1 Tax=[Lactobacillus] rogosae TaxID=706562 RepID=UPI00402AC191